MIKMKTWCYEISVYILQTQSFSIRVRFYEGNCGMSLTSFSEITQCCWGLCLWHRAEFWAGVSAAAEGGHK